MPIQKVNPDNPYAPYNVYDQSGNEPPQVLNDNLQEYRPSATFPISKVYTMQNCPAASSSNLGYIIYVIDAPADQKLQYSDGTQWQPIKW